MQQRTAACLDTAVMGKLQKTQIKGLCSGDCVQCGLKSSELKETVA